MADFSFSLDDLLSQTSAPFVRENMKNLAAPLNTSRSKLGASDFNGYASSSTASVSSILLGAPIFDDPVALQTSQQGALSTLLGATLPSTSKSPSGLGVFDALVPNDIILTAQQANTQQAKNTAAAAAAAAAQNNTGGTTTSTPSTTTPDPTGSGQVATAIAYARAQIGKPYIWGGTGPTGYDCSGLVMMAYKSAGINLPRTTYDMVNSGTAVADQASMIAGDLLLPDAGHVQLYIGNGRVIEAQHTGTNILEGPTWGFWRARRVATT